MLLFTFTRSQKYEKHELSAFGLCLIINGYVPATISLTELLTSPAGFFDITHLNLVLSLGLMFLIIRVALPSILTLLLYDEGILGCSCTPLAVVKNHCFKFTIHQNTVDNASNFIMWTSVVPHQVGITTTVEVAWIRRFLGEFHIHTP